MSSTRIEKKFRVGVLMGGRSVEREVSFNSGRTVCDHIDVDRYDIIPLFQTLQGHLHVLPWKFLHRGKISDFEHRLSSEATRITWDELKNRIDFMYIAVHGQYAEDGRLQGMLEVLGIPYLGSKVFASACGINKKVQKKFMQMQGICVPRDVYLTPAEVKQCSLDDILVRMEEENVSFPCVVKPNVEGSSVGICVVFDKDELLDALYKACYGDVTQEQGVLIEERLEGVEFTCIALQVSNLAGLDGADASWRPFPITQIMYEEGTHFYDYEQKYMPGRAYKVTPAMVSEADRDKIVKASVKTSDALGFTTFFRNDGFLTPDGRVVMIDPNSLSGMGPASFLFHQAAHVGMNHTALINYLIDAELDRYGLLDKVMCYHKQCSEKKMHNGVKRNIAVLLGGDSNEREISLESGRNVCYKLSPSKYNVIPLFVDDQMHLYKLSPHLLIQNSTREIREKVTEEMKVLWDDLPQIADFVFIALHGGKGENGSIQGAIEMLGLPYNGSGILASSLCMDKYKTSLFLKEQGFAVPASMLVTADMCETLTDVSFPCIVKPPDDGCSVCVYKVDSEESLQRTLQEYFETGREVALLEECVQGMELTCGVLGNEEIMVFPPSYAVARGGILSIEEKFLPGAGENQTPAPLPAHTLTFVQDIVKQAYVSAGCRGYARVDCFYQDEQTSPTGKERVVILEINSLPGLTPATCLFHQAAELSMKPMELIDKIIELGYQEHVYRVFERKEVETTA